MGKFYELFEMDAHVGVKELGLQYMKVLICLSASNTNIPFSCDVDPYFYSG